LTVSIFAITTTTSTTTLACQSVLKKLELQVHHHREIGQNELGIKIFHSATTTTTAATAATTTTNNHFNFYIKEKY